MFIRSYVAGPVMTNCYILGDEATHRAALIDPAAKGAFLVRKAKDAGYEVTKILLTHGHFDHIGGVKDAVKTVEEEFGVADIPVYIHKADYPIAPTSFDGSISLVGVENIHFYDEGSTVSVGSLTVKVLSTAGHTQGSVCLMVEDVMFTGDTLFAGSCGRTDFPNSSPVAMLESLQKLALVQGDYVVYAGHEASSTLAHEREHNPYMLYARRGGGNGYMA